MKAGKPAIPAYEVAWKGPTGKASGLGIASREYVKALHRAGVRVIQSGGKSRTAAAGSKRRQVLIYHYPPHTLNVRKERKHYDTIIVNTVWETTRIPERWVQPINGADAVFVPSRQNVRALRASGIRIPVYLVPHGVNIRSFVPRKKPGAPKVQRPFTFLSVFGFQHRKNPEGLLRAYWEEFSAAEPVRLIIKTKGYAKRENGRWIRGRIQAYKSQLGIRKRTAPVEIITGQISARSLRQLYARADAFVLPTRGEGVGLPFLEAMASGLPVIATGWGGQMDFLNRNNAFLVRYKLQPPVRSMNRKSSISRQFRSLFSGKGQRWAEPSLASLRRQMRAAYNNPGLCRKKGRQARRDAGRLTWERAGLAMKRAIEKTLMRK